MGLFLSLLRFHVHSHPAIPGGRNLRISFGTTEHVGQERKKDMVLAAPSIAALKTLDNLGEVGGSRREEKTPPRVLDKCSH